MGHSIALIPGVSHISGPIMCVNALNLWNQTQQQIMGRKGVVDEVLELL